MASSKRVSVLIGQAGTMYTGLVLGAPFLRKFPINFNNDNKKITVHCAENATCTKVPPRTLRTYSPSSGTSGGGGTSGGYGVDVDVETSRKRKTLYVGIGLGVAGVAILAMFGYCCKSIESTEDDSKQEDVELEVTVEEKKTGSISSEKGNPAIAMAESSRKKAGSDRGSDRGSSSGDDSESSEEERLVLRELRERRRRRRERRKEEEAKHLQGGISDGSKTSATGDTSTQEGYYVAAGSPKGKLSEL